MTNQPRILFIHGLAGSGQGFKATYLCTLYPELLAPDFPGDVWERMAQLEALIGNSAGWTMIGSSLGGLMATVFACQHPGQVTRLVLLAPALPFLDLEQYPLEPVYIPVTVIHGRRDDVVPMERTRELAERLFPNLTFSEVDATHDLNGIVPTLDWPALLDIPGDSRQETWS